MVVGDGNSAKMLQALTQRVRRQENMLHRCKEAIQSHKERSAQLTHEKEALQEQLDERLQELEKMKVLKETCCISSWKANIVLHKLVWQTMPKDNVAKYSWRPVYVHSHRTKHMS